MAYARRIAACFLLVALAGCSSAGLATNPTSTTASSASTRARDGKLILRVRIPRPKTRKADARPRYISAATKGMTFAFSGATSFTLAVDLTRADPACKGTPLVCTVQLDVPAGSYTVVVDAYDQAPQSGTIPAAANLLSTAKNVALSVARGKANPFFVTLDGVPAGFVVGSFPAAQAGTPFLSRSFVVTAMDADGDTIVGMYETATILSNSDTSGATAIGSFGPDSPPSGELLSSADTPTISYTGFAIAPVTIGATAAAAHGSGLFAVQLPVFVTDTNKERVDEVAPGCTSASCVTSLGGGFSSPTGVAVDASGNVFVGDNGGTVSEMPPNCMSAGCVTAIGGGFGGPWGIAIDGSDDVFVADLIDNAVKEVPAHCTSSSCVLVLGGGFSTPFGVAVDRAGNVFVADYGNDLVKKIPFGCGTHSCVTTLGGGFTHPNDVAVDTSGNVYETEGDDAAVDVIPAGCLSASCVTTLGGGLNAPSGVAVDGVGNVYVADNGNKVAKVIPPGCLFSTCVTTIGGGFFNTQAIAILH